VPDTHTPPGRRPGGPRGSARVISSRGDQDDGHNGADEYPTSKAWLLIMLESDEQSPARLAETERAADG
jgi:hypothetical protein